MSHPCDFGYCGGRNCSDCLPAGAVSLPRTLPHYPDDPAGWEDKTLPDINTCSEAEQVAYNRGMIEMAPIVSPFFSLTDRHSFTNNTFINRYLEDRTLRVPGTLYVCVIRTKR